MKKPSLAISTLLYILSATLLFSTPAEDAVIKQRMQAIADTTLSSSVIVSIKPKMMGVEEPILAVERERCPNCGNYHSTGYSEYIESEKSIFLIGYSLSEDTVIFRDILINPENIEGINVSKGRAVVGAQIQKIFKDQKAILLKLDRALPGIKPALIAPDTGKPESSVVVDKYRVGHAFELTAQARPSLGSPNRKEDGTTKYIFETDVVLFDASTNLCGFNFNAQIKRDENLNPASWTGITPEEMLNATKKITDASALSIVPVKLNFRAITPKRSSSGNRWSSRDDDDDKITELETIGTLVSENKIIIHLENARNEIPRLEKIRVFFPDGTEDQADFVCVHKNVDILIADLRKKHPEHAIKFAKEQLPEYVDKILMLVRTTSAGEGKTKIRSNRVRIQGIDSGWRDLPTVDLPLQEAAGDAIFNESGELLWRTVGILKANETIGRVERWRSNSRRMLLDAVTFAEFASPEAKDIDAAAKPATADFDGAIGWIGLDLQKLDAELAEAMNVITETEKGGFGAIVANVHPGSSADKAGVQNGWVILSIKTTGNSTPMKVQITDSTSFYSGRFPWDRLDDIPAQYADSIPAPWPAVKNDFTTQLLRMGVGTLIQAEFIANGEKITKELTIETSPKYYENAETFKWQDAGISVCNMTFEVREYLNLADDAPGVVVCRMETSGKAVISGIKQFEVITKVNGTEIESVKMFEDLVKNTTTFKLDVLRMTNMRVVQFTINDDDQPAADEAAETDEEEL